MELYIKWKIQGNGKKVKCSLTPNLNSTCTSNVNCHEKDYTCLIL